MEYKTDSPITTDFGDVVRDLKEAGCYEENMSRAEAIEIWKSIHNSLLKQKQTKLHCSPPTGLQSNPDAEQEMIVDTPVKRKTANPKNIKPATQQCAKSKSHADTTAVQEEIDWTPPYLDPKLKHLPLEERVKLQVDYNMKVVRDYGIRIRKQMNFAPWGEPVRTNVRFNGDLYRDSHPLYVKPTDATETNIVLNTSDEDISDGSQKLPSYDQEVQAIKTDLDAIAAKYFPKNAAAAAVAESGKQEADVTFVDVASASDEFSHMDVSKEKIVDVSPIFPRFRIPKKQTNDEIMAKSKLFAEPSKSTRSQALLQKAVEAEIAHHQKEKTKQEFVKSLQTGEDSSNGGGGSSCAQDVAFEAAAEGKHSQADEDEPVDHQMVEVEKYRRIVPPLPKSKGWLTKRDNVGVAKRKLLSAAAGKPEAANSDNKLPIKRRKRKSGKSDDAEKFDANTIEDEDDAEDFLTTASTSKFRGIFTAAATEECPICSKRFHKDTIEMHAARCEVPEDSQESQHSRQNDGEQKSYSLQMCECCMGVFDNAAEYKKHVLTCK